MKLPKLKYWYHATDLKTAEKILESGFLIPQRHKGDITLGVFFANTAENAGQWLLMRGVTDYVVFKIPRSRLNSKAMFVGGADRLPKELNMICMRHLDIVKVEFEDTIRVTDGRGFEIPGVEIFSEGTKKLGMKIVDIEAFEAYIAANPELKKMIDEEINALS